MHAVGINQIRVISANQVVQIGMRQKCAIEVVGEDVQVTSDKLSLWVAESL